MKQPITGLLIAFALVVLVACGTNTDGSMGETEVCLLYTSDAADE